MTAGYSGTSLANKLGIRDGLRVHAAGAPRGYRKLLGPLPAAVRFVPRADRATDLVQHFGTRKLVVRKGLR